MIFQAAVRLAHLIDQSTRIIDTSLYCFDFFLLYSAHLTFPLFLASSPSLLLSSSPPLLLSSSLLSPLGLIPRYFKYAILCFLFCLGSRRTSRHETLQLAQERMGAESKREKTQKETSEGN